MAKQKMSGTEQVEEFLKNLNSPLKKEVEAVRKIILAADKGITEQIKWNAPSFCFMGDDRITFNLSGKGMIRLIFHCGAKVKDRKATGPILEDKTKLLEWASDDRAILKLTDMSDVKSKEEALSYLVKQWIKASF